jgi:hypothetical protein
LTEIAPALEPDEDEGEAVTVLAPAQFVRLDEVEKQNVLVVVAPLAFTEPLSVAPDVVTLDAEFVITVGALPAELVVNEYTAAYVVVPTEFVAKAWK